MKDWIQRAHHDWSTWALAGLWSAAGVWVLANEIAVRLQDRPLWILVLVCVAVLLTFPARRLLRSAWRSLEGRGCVLWLTVCLASGLVLTFAIPYEVDGPVRLEVTATGDRAPASLGSAVSVAGLIRDGEPVPLSAFELGDGWEQSDLGVFSTGGEPLIWEGEAARGVSLILSTGPDLGIAEVSWQEEKTRIDLYDSGPGESTLSFDPSLLDIHRIILRLAAGLAFGLALLVVAAALLSRHAPRPEEDPSRPRRLEWLMLATPPAVVWAIHLLAFWPGVMTPDSMWQWEQLLTGRYDNWHPAFHTMLEWLLTRLVETPVMVAVTQIVALSGVVGWGLSSLRRIGLPSGVAWVMSVLIALWPPNGVFTVTLWKDIPYAIGVLALGVMLLREVDGRNPILDRTAGWAVVGGVTSLVALVHHAGPVVAAGSLLAFGLSCSWKRALAAAALAVVAFTLVRGPLFTAAAVANTSPPHAHAVVMHHLAAHLVDGTPLTAAEAEQIDRHPFLGDVSWYDCETVTPLVILPDFSMAALREGSAEALRLWWSLSTRNPGVDVRHTLCRSALVWRIGRLPGTYHYTTGLGTDAEGNLSTIVDNPHGLELDPVLPWLTGPLTEAIRDTEGFATAWLWWRAPLYLYALLFGVAIATLRTGNWRYWLVAVPAVMVAITLVIAAQAQDFRYAYPVFLSGLLLAPYLLIYTPREESEVKA